MATLAAPTIEMTAPDIMTWAEIRAIYPDQWVGLVDIARNSDVARDLKSARVVSHGEHPGEVLQQLRPMRARYQDAMHIFTGKILAPFPRFL